MKFGKNLQDLSIPEWKAYNLDYNHLKSIIKELNYSNSHELKPLHNAFQENFQSINLFVNIKFGEILRKLQFYENNANNLMNKRDGDSSLSINDTNRNTNSNPNTNTHTNTNINTNETNETSEEIKQIKLDILLSNLIDLSLILKKLSKFIVIQKIACKKIFKKFLKYYYNEDAGSKLILKLKLKLSKDPKSFINMNLHSLTLELTNLINLIKFEIKNETSISPHGSVMSDYLTHMNDSSLPESLRFDLNCLIKKNFHLSFIIPDDVNNFNEILLNFSIYLNLKPVNVCTKNSIIYLQNDDNLLNHPSYIISEYNQPNSLVISYIGGLRKFSYCSLPNDIVNILLSYVMDFSNMDLKQALKAYFHTTSVNSLTKLTVESILNNELRPKVRSFFNVNRYYLSKFATDSEDNAFTTVPQDDYLIQLLLNISTTVDEKYLFQIDLLPEMDQDNERDSLDPFPFNILYLYSNESNLLEFSKNILSEIEDTLLVNKYHDSLLNKLPPKIQKIVKNNNSINLFQGFNFYEYCLSCYYNCIPNNLNNHYNNLLSLNLFKTFENTETFNKDMNYHNLLIKSNEDRKLKNQLSLNDLENKALNKIQFDLSSQVSNTNASGKRPKIRKDNSNLTLSSFNLSVFTDKIPNNDEIDEIIYYEDNESLKMFWKSSDNPYNLQSYHTRAFQNYNSIEQQQLTKRWFSNVLDNLMSFQLKGTNEQSDASSLLLENYHYNYNMFMAFFYFALTFVSIFISGIELGIIFSILEIDKAKFALLSNLWLLFVLIVGIMISFISSLISINLIFKRLSRPPSWHYGIVSVGLILVVICGILVLLLSFM